jgi:hypothetical protein
VSRRARGSGMVLGLALVAGAVALAAFPVLRDYQPHDEGLMLQWAARVGDGQWPYRDFWCNYGPGQVVVLAGLVKLFGPSLLWWRILRLLVGGVVALLAYLLVRRYASPAWALGAWLAAAGAMAFPLGPGPTAPAVALALGALLAAPRAPAGAGALAGVASVFRPELGAAAILGVLLARPRGGLRAFAAFALVGVALWLPFLVVSPGDLWDQTAGFLSKQGLQRLPFPWRFHGPLRPSKLIEFYIPLILVAGTALWAMVALVRRLPLRLLAPAPLIGAGVVYLLGRTDIFHLVPLAAVLPVALATAAGWERAPMLRAALGAALALVALHGLDRQAGQLLHPPRLVALRLPAADGVRVAPGDATALQQLYRFVHRRVPRGGFVWVANPRHDLVRVGNTMLYVLLDVRNPTRYDTMQPGVITSAPVQREVIRALERGRTKLVVRWLDPTADRREPNGAGRSSGVHLLDRFLARRYHRVARFGEYAVLARGGA